MVTSICGWDDGSVGMLKGAAVTDMHGHVHEAVKRARDDERSVPVEMHGSHIVDMGVQRFGTSTCNRVFFSDTI
jgi:hypothetical protein